MAKNKEKVQETATQGVDVTSLPTNAEVRSQLRSDIEEQRALIEQEKEGSKNAANIEAARQNIKTLRQNAAEEIQANRKVRQLGYANDAVDAVKNWMKESGKEQIDEQTLSNILTPQQLWYFQKYNNKGSNRGTALGGNAFFGKVNADTVSRINAKAKEKYDAEKAAEEGVKYSDEAILTDDETSYMVGNIAISNKKLNDMKDWGDTVADANSITPEQVQELYQKLEGYNIKVPKVGVVDAEGKPVMGDDGNQLQQYDINPNNYTVDDIYDALDDVLGDEGDMLLDALGFRDSETGRMAIPHRETYEEMMARRNAYNEEIKLLNQQKAIDRQKARLGLSDIAAGIGDMIKSSGGAIVNPRDYKQMYDSLTAQQQTNFNNYLARMEALKQEQKAKQLLADERAYKEKQDAIQREWQAEEYRKNREHEAIIASINASGTISKAQAEQLKDSINTTFGGKTYAFQSKEQANQTMQSIFGIIQHKISGTPLMEEFNNMFARLEGKGLDNGEITAVITRAALARPEIANDAELSKRISDILLSDSYSSKNSAVGTTPTATPTATHTATPTAETPSYVGMLTGQNIVGGGGNLNNTAPFLRN